MGATNFWHDHRCIVVPSECLETGEHPYFGNRIDLNHNYPMVEIDLDNNETFATLRIIYAQGYYEDACLTAVITDPGDVYDSMNENYLEDSQSVEELTQLVFQWMDDYTNIRSDAIKTEVRAKLISAVKKSRIDMVEARSREMSDFLYNTMHDDIIPYLHQIELKRADEILDNFRDMYQYDEVRKIANYTPMYEKIN